jgi:hypothetical protein
MSFWGTGVKQCDEFGDVYEEFFEQYVDDADPINIADSIWQEYISEFADDGSSPILYTVRYALAQCLWECGAKKDTLWSEIEDIIKTGKDLVFWSDLETGDHLMNSRRKNLETFWDKINSEPQKRRKPKKTTVSRKPTLQKGDIYAYPFNDGGYRAFVVFDFVWNSYLIAVTDTVFKEVPDAEKVWDSKTELVFWSSQRAAIPKKDRIVIGHIEIEGDYNGRAGLICTEKTIGCSSCADRSYCYDSEQARISMKRNNIGSYTMHDLLEPKSLPWFFD